VSTRAAATVQRPPGPCCWRCRSRTSGRTSSAQDARSSPKTSSAVAGRLHPTVTEVRYRDPATPRGRPHRRRSASSAVGP
jgi:hypothetical protein